MARMARQETRYAGTLLNAREAAHALGVGKDTFYTMLKSGTCPIEPVYLGKRRLFRRADIERFLGVAA